MYTRLLCLGCAILALTGFGCQPSPSKKQVAQSEHTIHINIVDEPQVLDPRKARDLKAQTIVHMLFEGLTRINPLEKAEPALAEKIEISPDLKTYTFHLKKSLWSNGDPVVASDFVYAWKKILSRNFPSDTAFNLYVIKNAKEAKEGKVDLDEVGVHAINDLTLVVELENPIPYFLELTTFPPFFPVNQKVDQKNPSWAQDAKTYVGNGPFYLEEWKHQGHLKVRKNPKYWDSKSVKVDAIQMQILPPDTELKLFEKNELEWAGSPLSVIPVDAIKTLRRKDILKNKEMLGTCFIRLNVDAPPFNEPLMRRAFALGINRRAIVDHITQGGQIPATGLVPTSLKLQDKPYFQDADAQTARKLFAKGLQRLGLKKEQLPEITLTYRSEERNHLVVQAIQQQWFETFGIRIKLEATENKVLFDRVSKQDYQLAFGGWIADFADPINFLELFKYKNGGCNNTLWENPRFTELLDQSVKASDPLKRQAILKESEKILIEDMPIIPVFYHTMLYVSQPALKNVLISSMGNIDFRWASIEEGIKAVAKENHP